MLDALRIRVQREDLAAFAQQMNQVAPVTAAGVENPHARQDIPTQYLIEDVDIDLPELFLNGKSAAQIAFAFNRSTTIGGTSSLMSPPSRNTPLISRELT